MLLHSPIIGGLGATSHNFVYFYITHNETDSMKGILIRR